jgi:hypothetical protein
LIKPFLELDVVRFGLFSMITRSGPRIKEQA